MLCQLLLIPQWVSHQFCVINNEIWNRGSRNSFARESPVSAMFVSPFHCWSVVRDALLLPHELLASWLYLIARIYSLYKPMLWSPSWLPLVLMDKSVNEVRPENAIWLANKLSNKSNHFNRVLNARTNSKTVISWTYKSDNAGGHFMHL